MSRATTVIPLALLCGFSLFANAPLVNAAIKSPACPELVKISQQITPGQITPVNQTPSRFSVPTAFAGAAMARTFGLPVLEWSQADVALAIKLTGDCATAAKKAKNKPDITSLTLMWRSFGALKATLGSIAATEPKIDAWLEYLLGHAPSVALLDSLVVVASVRDGGAESMAKTDKALKDSSLRLNSWEHPHTHAQNLLKTLRDAPAQSWGRVFPPIDKSIVAVRQAVIDATIAQINATPANLQGLGKLAPTLTRTRAILTASLTEAEIASIDEAGRTRRDAIEDALLAEEVARIETVPATVSGLNQLRGFQQSQVKAALSPTRVAMLDGKITERRSRVGGAVADEQINRLEQFPETMTGLRELATFKNDTSNGLNALVGPEAAAKFTEAATRRASKIGTQAFDPFRRALTEIPASDDGLIELDRALNEIGPAIQSLDDSVRARYVEAAAKQREKMVKAIMKEDARLAKLPLDRGAIFVDRVLGAKLEFRNRERVYVTVFNETLESEFELDGDRLIIRLPSGNQVFKRDGAWIRSAELNFKRQPE
jgi:hypothetical protein